MADPRFASHSTAWRGVLIFGAVFALVFGAAALASKPQVGVVGVQGVQAGAKATNGTNTTLVERPYSAGQSKQDAGNGLSYETYIPRPTAKGYYEPKVVPYPAGKPVHVNGYYRKNGTYVQPHFRSLPRR